MKANGKPSGAASAGVNNQDRVDDEEDDDDGFIMVPALENKKKKKFAKMRLLKTGVANFLKPKKKAMKDAPVPEQRPVELIEP